VRHQYFGAPVNPHTFAQWLDAISAVLTSGQRRWLCGHHNLHSLYLLRCDNDVRRFYARCNDCYIDGMPVRLILKGFGISTSTAQRFSLMDHFLELLQHAERQQWSVFYLGSQESVVQSGRTLLNQLFPGLRIQLQHGYATEQIQVIDAINALRPDILLVGLGMPQQERWLVEHLDQLDVGFAAQAGGTLDYFTGAQAKPPQWLSRIGLAWLYRLLNDPRRLWRRYLLEPWTLLRPTLRYWHCYRNTQRIAQERAERA
jgi:N-acetylglucosaminyldiphosphoundecaprenol N-acetyl-beta-D-mannosaminyltransferase